jgi:hypothetical protein
MIFHAISQSQFLCAPYRISLTTYGWSLWKRKRCLGREMTISEALSRAKADNDKGSTNALRPQS